MRLKDIDGLPVFDAKSAIILKITKRDTTNATEQEPAQCAVARACKRELHAKEVRVHLSRAYVRLNDSDWLRYIVPPYMRTEIIAFDRGGTFAPGEYRLPAPPPSKQNRKKTKRSPRKGSGKKRQPPHIVQDVRGGPA